MQRFEDSARSHRQRVSPNRPDDPSGQQRILVKSLRAGVRLEQDIFDENGVLLLRAGSEITTRFHERLSARKIGQIICRQSAARTEQKRAARTKPRTMARAEPKSVTPEATRKIESPATRRLDAVIEETNFARQHPLPDATFLAPPRLGLERLREELKTTQLHYSKSVHEYARFAGQ